MSLETALFLSLKRTSLHRIMAGSSPLRLAVLRISSRQDRIDFRSEENAALSVAIVVGRLYFVAIDLNAPSPLTFFFSVAGTSVEQMVRRQTSSGLGISTNR